jgi:glycosyltransferase involved in cell wall biosynthesis
LDAGLSDGISADARTKEPDLTEQLAQEPQAPNGAEGDPHPVGGAGRKPEVLRIGLAVRSLDEKWGIGVYTREILTRILQIDSRNQYFILYGSPNHLGAFSSHPNVREVVLPCFSRIIWDQVQVAYAASQLRLDVVFSPKMSAPFFFRGGTLFAIFGAEQFVHSREFPLADRLYVRTFLPILARKADRVLASTAAVVSDLTHHLGVAPEKLAVTPLGPKDVFRQDVAPERIAAVRSQYGLDGAYLLHVGRTELWKNFEVLPRVLERLNAGGRRLVLAHAGKPRQRRSAHGAADERDILELGFVPDEDLAALYRGAVALVFPSVYEGFGIPLVEAMASGCPVVAAGWGAMLEVCDGAGLLVDTRDPEAIAGAVERILSEPALREDLVRRGIERARAFTWDATARRTLQLILEVGGAPAPGRS